ncbi:hypothetical protein IWW43_002325 [Coemansia sp. RSA 1935]|nr:hypothetical protein EV181_006740 [Coemansia sp. RSA 532]KAJ2192616.1 hypothetical protein IW145_006641 [Coemansia sp. RSA 521]KAJ2534536.1 hypothetical protein IWW43_002325 [Coemansia sp. RSA 1935]
MLLSSLAINPALGADEAIINPLGITFEYKLSWVNVESSTFGVSLLATKQSTFKEDTEWSLLMRYAPDAQANITAISNGWGLGVYDYASWALLPGKSPFEAMHMTLHTSGHMSLEDTVVRHAEPQTLVLVPEAKPSKDFIGYTLIKNRDFTVNTGVNLAEIPKDAYGSWLLLKDTNVESILDITAEPSSSSTKPTPTPTKSSVSESTSASATSSFSVDINMGIVVLPTSDSEIEDGEKGAHAGTTVTVLPPVKYIKGDPNYDPDVNPIGTMLGAPKIGLYLVNTILGVGVIAHILGTIRRYQYRRQFQMSVMRSKNNSLA